MSSGLAFEGSPPPLPSEAGDSRPSPFALHRHAAALNRSRALEGVLGRGGRWIGRRHLGQIAHGQVVQRRNYRPSILNVSPEKRCDEQGNLAVCSSASFSAMTDRVRSRSLLISISICIPDSDPIQT